MAAAEHGQSKKVTIVDLGAAVVTGKVSMMDLATGLSQSGAGDFFDDDDSKFDSQKSRSSSKGGRRGADAVVRCSSRRSTHRRSTVGLDSMDDLGVSRKSSMNVRATMSMSGWMRSSLMGSEVEQAENRESPMARKMSKRRTCERKKTLLEALDDFAEQAVQGGAAEKPWYMDHCVLHPACERICFPADRATRRKRGNVQADGTFVETKNDVGDSSSRAGGEQRFGLPDFAEAGYSLVAEDDLILEDPQVYVSLGLTIASHIQTSVSRYCLRVFKAELPKGVGATEVVALVRQLQKCDHINVLVCKEAFEDTETVYLMYEYFPCVTLRSVFEDHSWSQPQIVNLIREIAAGVAFAQSNGLNHLALHPGNILLPASVKHGNMDVAKVFGFGLLGTMQDDCDDHLSWSPECLERYSGASRDAPCFVTRMDGGMRSASDAWSLGVLAFLIASRTRPFLDEIAIARRQWKFTLAFDVYDPEARSLVEGFLAPLDRRCRVERALNHEWIRKRWRPPPGQTKIFAHLEEFVSSKMPKRLFGRFLTRFLDAEHMRAISSSFNALDTQGCGTISIRELAAAARAAGKPQAIAAEILDWLAAPGLTYISLGRFAEAFAEEVIDGRALRHAFESLDDDGSEEVSPEELYDVLREMDDRLTLQDVVEHIRDAEAEAAKVAQAAGADDGGENAGGNEDQAIDYNEFCQLFPVRVRRVKATTERLHTERSTAEQLSGRFQSHYEENKEWIDKMRTAVENVTKLAEKSLERTDEGQESAKGLKKEFARLNEALCKPPGPYNEMDYRELTMISRRDYAKQMGKDDAAAGATKRKAKGAGLQISEELGFDSFLQDSSLIDTWSLLLFDDIRMMKGVLMSANRLTGSIDQYKAHDIAEGLLFKVNDVVGKASMQLQEYESFVDAMNSPEATLLGSGGVGLSGRGIRGRPEDGDDGDAHRDEGDDVAGAMARFFTEVTSRFSVN